MKYIAALIACLIWNLSLLFGTCYYVFERDHSGWWFLLMAVLIVKPVETNKKGDDNE